MPATDTRLRRQIGFAFTSLHAVERILKEVRELSRESSKLVPIGRCVTRGCKSPSTVPGWAAPCRKHLALQPAGKPNGQPTERKAGWARVPLKRRRLHSRYLHSLSTLPESERAAIRVVRAKSGYTAALAAAATARAKLRKEASARKSH